jgi:hypothetical protein
MASSITISIISSINSINARTISSRGVLIIRNTLNLASLSSYNPWS